MDIKAYYMDITTNNITTIKKLKNEIAGYQKCKSFIQRKKNTKLNCNKLSVRAEISRSRSKALMRKYNN